MSKYRAIPTAVDGIIFASKKEAHRYGELKMLERAGIIEGLKLQPKFPIVIESKLVCTYIADFTYIDQMKRVVVEDVKGMKTPVYRLKKKLVEARYPHLRITEL